MNLMDETWYIVGIVQVVSSCTCVHVHRYYI
jgi:hypothetical protein